MSPSSYQALQRGMWEHNSPPPSTRAEAAPPRPSTNFDETEYGYEALAGVMGLDLEAPLGKSSPSAKNVLPPTATFAGGEVDLPARPDSRSGAAGVSSWSMGVPSIVGGSTSSSNGYPADPLPSFPPPPPHFYHDRHVSTSSAPGNYSSTQISSSYPPTGYIDPPVSFAGSSSLPNWSSSSNEKIGRAHV